MNIEKILKSVILSEDMRNHLINGGLERSCRDIEEIIFSSPIQIEEKYELLKGIEADVREDVKYKVLPSDDDKTVEWKRWRQQSRMQRRKVAFYRQLRR